MTLQKNKVMKINLLFTVLLLLVIACHKSDLGHEADTFNSGPFFINKAELKEKLSIELSKRYKSEKLIDIKSISYINSDSTQYAVIFYNTNTGNHNILFEKSNNPGENEQFKITTCDSLTCACKVNVTIDDQGRVITSCSCGSCLMITQ